MSFTPSSYFSERSLPDQIARDLTWIRCRFLGDIMALSAGNVKEAKRLSELQFKKLEQSIDEMAARNARPTPLAMRDAEIAVKPGPKF